MRSPRLWLAVATVVLCVGNLAFTLWRSTIPIGLDGTIESIEYLTEKNPGIDDVYILSVDGEEFAIDKEVASRLTANVHVSKDPWSTELTVGRGATERTVALEVSEDFGGMLWVVPVIFLVVLLASSPRARGPRDYGPRRAPPA